MKEKLERITDNEWHLPMSARKGMRVDGKIIANKKILDEIEDQAVEQLTNVACLPGIVGPVVGLPDMHWGYGLPMGAAAAFNMEEGVISAGLCGFDINCGINSIKSNLEYSDVQPKLKELTAELFKRIPVGMTKGKLRLTDKDVDDVLINGVNFAVDKGYGTKEDVKATEELGCMQGADPSILSPLAKKRGKSLLGTLGGGNHFLEIQKIAEVNDVKTAKLWGIDKVDNIGIMLHCGSRGLGHQVASDYMKTQSIAAKKYKINLPDNQLACAPINSKEGEEYYKAMKCAVNYAFANRLIMTHNIREAFEAVFKRDWESMELHTVYGIAHNIVKHEKIHGKEYYIHRKGATRSYPDKPVLIAGTMGTSSYICKGTEDALKKTFGSSCHGAGRAMSRTKAMESFCGCDVKDGLAKRGIIAMAPTDESFAEEAPGAYKDVMDVVDSVHKANISTKVVRLEPLGVIKG